MKKPSRPTLSTTRPPKTQPRKNPHTSQTSHSHRRISKRLTTCRKCQRDSRRLVSILTTTPSKCSSTPQGWLRELNPKSSARSPCFKFQPLESITTTIRSIWIGTNSVISSTGATSSSTTLTSLVSQKILFPCSRASFLTRASWMQSLSHSCKKTSKKKTMFMGTSN